MKLSLILVLLTIITVSCEGPTGPQGIQGDLGPQGEQGIQGEVGTSGLSVTMFDHSVVFADYYQSNTLVDGNTGQGAWMAGIEHDSIKVTSDINVFFNLDTVQIWRPFDYIGEVLDGKLGLFDPNINFYVGSILRVIVTNVHQ